MTYRFIHSHCDVWPVRLMCATLEVAPAGYYAWLKRPPAIRTRRRDALLAARGQSCSVNTVAQIMRQNGIRSRSTRKFRRRTTDSKHGLPVADNLLDRRFAPKSRNKAWAADITYIPTRQGWLYLAVVEDLHSRRIVGWAMADNMQSRLVVDALEMAVARRLPGAGLLAHSDRGSQYASEHYQRLLDKHGIRCSMSRVAQCWDNAPAESFFASLKKELVHHQDFQSQEQARTDIVEYIEVFYNQQRLHSALNYQTPASFEQHGPP